MHPLRLALVPTLISLSVGLGAEEPVAPPEPQPEPQPLVIQATRLSDEPFEQPYAYHRLDQPALGATTGRTLTDRIGYSPGVIMQKTGPGQASPYIRGLTGEQTLLLLDGVRLNHAMMRPGPNQYAALVPEESIGSVDVILGSGSTALGSDALTGAIDFRLAPAGRGVGRAVSPWLVLRGASAEGTSGSVGLDGEVGDWAYSVEGGLAHYHDLRGGKDAGEHLFFGAAGDRDIPNTAYDQHSYGGRVAYTGLADQRIELAIGRVVQEDAPRPDGYAENTGTTIDLTNPPGTFPDRISRYYDPQVFTYAHLRHIISDLGPFDRLQTTAWFHEQHEEQVREDVQATAGVGRYRRREFDDTIATLGVDLQATSLVAETHELTYGVTGYQDRTDNRFARFRSPNGTLDPDDASDTPDQTGTTNPGNTTLPDGSRYQGFGVYLQDLWRIDERWSLLAGVRYDRNSWEYTVSDDRPGFDDIDPLNPANADAEQTFSDSADAFSANLRLSWQASDELMLFSGVSQGFRAPNLSNLAGAQDRGSGNIQVQGNPDLEAERSLTGEIGAKYRDGTDTDASITLFATRIDDLMQPVYDGGTARMENTEHALLLGGEIAGRQVIPTGDLLPEVATLSVYQATSYVSGEAEVPQLDGTVEEQHISRANRLFGKAGLRLDWGPQWWAATQVRWSDRYDEVAPGDAGDIRHLTFAAKGEAPGAMPGYVVWDLLAGWRSADRRYFVTGELENLLDRSYRVVGSGNDGPGLNAVLTVGARF